MDYLRFMINNIINYTFVYLRLFNCLNWSLFPNFNRQYTDCIIEVSIDVDTTEISIDVTSTVNFRTGIYSFELFKIFDW